MENAYGQLRTPSTKQGCLEYCYTHEKWKHLDQEPSTYSSRWKWWLCLGVCFWILPSIFPSPYDVVWLILPVHLKGNKARQYSTILVFCQQMAVPLFLFSRRQVTKGKLWCLSGPADFLHFYLNIQLCFFPVPSGPWKLFLIRLCGSKEADPRFIGPVGEPLWQKQFKVTNAKLSADLWKGFLWRLPI